MAKNLTKEEKIKKAKNKRKIKTTTKVIMTVIGAAIAVPLLYYLYIGVVFYLFPRFDYNSNNVMGAGYSRPLNIVSINDHSEYTLAYYIDGCWHVVDDTEQIKKNTKRFIVFKSDDEWRKDSDRELYVFRDTDCVVHTSLSSFALIYDNFFKDYEKKMTMEEFEQYCLEKQFAGLYIFGD